MIHALECSRDAGGAGDHGVACVVSAAKLERRCLQLNKTPILQLLAFLTVIYEGLK